MKTIHLGARFNTLLKLGKLFLMSLGGLFLIALILSFTDYPFWAMYWLGTHNAELDVEPSILVLMGGGGMPSADGLNRCYHAAKTAHYHKNCKIIIAVPADTTREEESPEKLMAHELKIRGIDSSRFIFESEGTNTYSQVMNIKKLLSDRNPDSIAIRIITSPDHVLRSVAVFRKAGFKHVGGHPSFEEDIKEDLLLEKKDRATLRQEKLLLRYNMWNYLKYEITVLREYCAIVYYKIRGWI
jgi:uncharacterized SAM-binding protein YcdF (DUF218 family)